MITDMKFKKYFPALLLIFCLTIYFKQSQNKQKNDTLFDFSNDSHLMISGNLSTDYSITQTLKDIDDLNLQAINLPIVINIEDTSASTMAIDQASLNKAKKLLNQIEHQDIAIILEPYPWIADGSQYETDWNPTNKKEFFNSWENNILQPLIKEVANPYDIEVVNIGTSFNYMEHFEDEWINVIQNIRKNYNGWVTYRTSWWKTASWDEETLTNYQKKLHNKLFGHLDFISIAAYFELTEKAQPSTSEIIDAIHSTQIYHRQQNVQQEIENFYKKWQKPIFFGELGFPKTTYATKHPWDPYASSDDNNYEQSKGFEAYLDVFGEKEWFIGFSIFSIGEASEDKMYYPSLETKKTINKYNKHLKRGIK